MFGYVTITPQQAGEKNFEVFRSYYCGLCRAMGRQCSQASRLSLSYDMTFLGIMLSSVLESDTYMAEGRCAAHPLKKRGCVLNSDALNYSANMGVMLSYLKMLDDWHDDKSIKALAAMIVLYGGVRRARKKYAEEYFFITACLDELRRLEKERCADIDRVSDCFARILRRLFAPGMIKESKTRDVLEWFGYNLGRWIYIIDAVNDIDADYKSGAYNPFLAGFDGGIEERRAQILQNQSIMLTMTLKNLAGAFDLLNIKKNQELLGKIVYGSLYAKQGAVLRKLSCETGEKHGSI